MFLPSFERYSTVACAPTENSASPTEVICPDKDWLSGVGCEWPAARMGCGVDQAAIVKQNRNSVARHIEVRNRIEFPPIRFGPGPSVGHELRQKGRKFRIPA